MDINRKDRAEVRLQVAEALRWVDAHSMIDVGIHLDRALVAFDVEVETAALIDGGGDHKIDVWITQAKRGFPKPPVC